MTKINVRFRRHVDEGLSVLATFRQSQIVVSFECFSVELVDVEMPDGSVSSFPVSMHVKQRRG